MNDKNKIISDWIDKYTDKMLSWTSYKVSDTENAKDIVQETFLAVAKNIDKFKNDSKPSTWIFSILNNKISDYYRKRYKQAELPQNNTLSNFFNSAGEWLPNKLPEDWHEDENLLDNLEFIEVLNYCIENLPSKFNSVIRMKYYQEKKADEICQELEIQATNMWQMMHRAKLKLRDCINNKWFKE